MQRCYPSPEEQTGWSEQALRDRDWAVHEDGDNTGTTHFWRSFEPRGCCHCPPTADTMLYSIFQYPSTARGRSCAPGQVGMSTCPEGLCAQDLAQGEAQFWAEGLWSCREGDPREGESTVLAWEGAEVHGPRATGHIYPPPSHPLCLSAWQAFGLPWQLCTLASPRMPRRVFAHPPTVEDPSPHQPAYTHPHAVPVCSQEATQMRTEQTVLAAPCPSEHRRSGHTEGFRTFVAALQLAHLQQKYNNNNRFFASSGFKQKVEFLSFPSWSSLQFH